MPIKSFIIGKGKLEIGSTASLQSLSAQCTSGILKPSVSKGDKLVVLSSEEIAGDRSESWTLSVTLLQDFGQIGSLSEWLFTNRGTQQPFTFLPYDTSAKQITGQLVVEAMEIGGEVTKRPTSDVEFDLIGAPVFAPKA